MIMIFLFPIAFVGAFLLLIALRRRAGRWSAARGGPLLLLATLAASYLAAFVMLNLDPSYDDNGWPEFMELRYRWVWAAVFGGMFSLVTVPAAFAFRALWLWWRDRHRNKGPA